MDLKNHLISKRILQGLTGSENLRRRYLSSVFNPTRSTAYVFLPVPMPISWNQLGLLVITLIHS